MELDEYVTMLYPMRDTLLEELPAQAEEQGVPRIHIPDDVGRLLQVLIVSAGIRKILEIGTLFGYSSIWMARALPSDGSITSLEVSEKHANLARLNLDAAGVGDKVEIRVGEALSLLPKLEGTTYDLVFIDADKAGYLDYLDWAVRLAHNGTIIVADNTWRHGGVLTDTHDEGNRVMADFNRHIAENEGLVSCVIPTRGGGDATTVAVVR